MRGWLAQGYLCTANAVLHVVSKALGGSRRGGAPKRIVVLRVGNIGDTLTALPALGALRRRFPAAHIALLTSPGEDRLAGARELLAGSSLFDEMIRYTKEDIRGFAGKRALLRKVRNVGPDLFIDLAQDQATIRTGLRNLLFARLAGARQIIVGRLVTPPFWRRQHGLGYEPQQDAVRTLEILRPLGIREETELKFPLPIPSEAEREAEALFAGLTGPVVGCCPGGKRSINRWPVERFAEVLRDLRSEGVHSVIVGGPADRDLAASIQTTCPEARDATGKDLLTTAAMLKRCAILVTNDTGPMHLAAAVGTPCVAIFSARDYQKKWYPYGARHKVLRTEPSCSLCFLESCPTMHCNRDITSEQVRAAVRRLINERVPQDILAETRPDA